MNSGAFPLSFRPNLAELAAQPGACWRDDADALRRADDDLRAQLAAGCTLELSVRMTLAAALSPDPEFQSVLKTDLAPPYPSARLCSL